MRSSAGANTGPKNAGGHRRCCLPTRDILIAERAGMHCRAVESLRQRFVEDGFEVTLEGKARGHRPRALQGKDEARLITLACGQRPLDIAVIERQAGNS
jgi:transposase